ncbi:MAG: RNA polymerase sigma-70 factor [Mangrovibacterium sp.]
MAKREHNPDYNLIDDLCNGDLEAFDIIFKKYGDRLFGFALTYLKSREETEELVQDVFLKLWVNRKNLKKQSSLKSYLFTIAYHNMCRLFREKQIHGKFREEIIAIGNRTVNLEEQLEYKSTLEQIDCLIGKLPEKQRVIFLKSRKEGKSSKEIADEMNLESSTVDNQISLAIKFLKKNLPEGSFAVLLYFAMFP